MINNHDEDDDYVYEEDYNDDGDDDTSRGTQSYECLAPALPCRLLILKPIKHYCTSKHSESNSMLCQE